MARLFPLPAIIQISLLLRQYLDMIVWSMQAKQCPNQASPERCCVVNACRAAGSATQTECFTVRLAVQVMVR